MGGGGEVVDRAGDGDRAVGEVEGREPGAAQGDRPEAEADVRGERADGGGGEGQRAGGAGGDRGDRSADAQIRVIGGGRDGQVILVGGGGHDGVGDRTGHGGTEADVAERQGGGVSRARVIVGRAAEGDGLRRQTEVGQAGAGQGLGGERQREAVGEGTRREDGDPDVAGGAGGDVGRGDEGELGVAAGRADRERILEGGVGNGGVGDGDRGGGADADIAEGLAGGDDPAGVIVGHAGHG